MNEEQKGPHKHTLSEWKKKQFIADSLSSFELISMAENVGEENNMVTLLGCVHDCVHERALPFSISLQPLSTHISTAHLTKQISDDAPISSSALSLHSTTHTDEITMHNCMRTHARGHTHTLTYWSSPDCTESFTP